MLAKRNYSAKVISKFQSVVEIKDFLSKPEWKVSSLLDQVNNTGTKSIDQSQLIKLLQLSGLSTKISRDDDGGNGELIKSLNNQINFINHLHSIKIFESKNYNIDSRIIRQDLPALKYGDIIEQINNCAKPDLLKGEIPKNWDPMKLASENEDGYYIVKEGLIKDEKN
ncbi:hypothetical protein PACTADRAFT_38515 [Pachysolen tannophilus NRRL Y-2460]|uniref:Glu-AdT subunit F n=1 Tax=Pachysolen tannophilus NRRL Y-2460 TaxID=669874 RepID=A0A1E4TYP5_PACTA|nr:hypothetical protein PACTADRAFT_38515 [Pachysolen tannophilus NRRL Y-2460]